MPLDPREGSITLDVAKKAVAAAAVETFERYHTEDLAAGANYVPADEGLFSASKEGGVAGGDLEIELQTSEPAWRRVLLDAYGNDAVIGDGTNLRFVNGGGVLREFVVMRHHISTGTYERYNTQQLAGTTSYTPAGEGLFSLGAELPQVRCEYQYSAGVWWYYAVNNSAGIEFGVYLAIGDGANLRFYNSGALAKWYVCMRAIMVT